ncbi:hypothetical protein MAM1_0079d04461 [Mucor ambiguus]|uniref:Uncharacterized protein n=1 Tax=Mucor ambiguus TaxID=91626 RepID=A0A0C9MSE0_9FUNG|nr:hypothetical protein MAM1_0079d04461 [Mucor ambiguus]
MPAEDASTIAPDIAFNNLVVGHIDEKSVQTSYPDSAGNVIPEQRGGVAAASLAMTFASYCKKQLLNVDHRFATNWSHLPGLRFQLAV